MSQPRPPKLPATRRNSESNAGTLLAVFFILLLAGGFLALLGAATQTGFFFFIPVLLIAATLVGLLHYLVWGRLLSQRIIEEDEAKAQFPESGQ